MKKNKEPQKPKTLLAKQVRPYEILMCSLTGQKLFCGDWYYEEDGKIYLYEAYHQRKQIIKDNKFNYSRLLMAQSKEEYKNMLKQYERDVLGSQLDERFNNEGE